MFEIDFGFWKFHKSKLKLVLIFEIFKTQNGGWFLFLNSSK